MAITAQDVQGMVSHWLGTPPGGYLGSDYGSGIQDLLHTPLLGGGADAIVAKLRVDVPILGQLPPNAVNLYSQATEPDGLAFFVEVAGVVTVPAGVAAASA